MLRTSLCAILKALRRLNCEVTRLIVPWRCTTTRLALSTIHRLEVHEPGPNLDGVHVAHALVTRAPYAAADALTTRPKLAAAMVMELNALALELSTSLSTVLAVTSVLDAFCRPPNCEPTPHCSRTVDCHPRMTRGMHDSSLHLQAQIWKGPRASARLVGLRERGRKLERKKAASYLLASDLIVLTSIFIRLELSMEDHV